jgi:hypothetical protein
MTTAAPKKGRGKKYKEAHRRLTGKHTFSPAAIIQYYTSQSKTTHRSFNQHPPRPPSYHLLLAYILMPRYQKFIPGGSNVELYKWIGVRAKITVHYPSTLPSGTIKRSLFFFGQRNGTGDLKFPTEQFTFWGPGSIDLWLPVGAGAVIDFNVDEEIIPGIKGNCIIS